MTGLISIFVFVCACVGMIWAHPQVIEGSGDCPSFCECDGESQVVTCSGVTDTSWSDFLFRLPTYTEEIILSSCIFDDLSSADALKMPRVWNLEVTHCVLNMQPESFQPFPNLAKMKLNECGLTSIHGAFVGLANLRILDLTDNLIEELHDDSLRNLGKLISLDLTNNVIGDVHVYAFHDVPLLEYLSLRHNDIVYIHPLTFSNLTAVETLDISFNNLVTLHQETILGLPALEQVSIMNNHLQCNCGLRWLWDALRNDTTRGYFTAPDDVTCFDDIIGSDVAMETANVDELSCVSPEILMPIENIHLHALRSVWVQANVTGSPPPLVYWITPRGVLADPADRPWITPDVVQYNTSRRYKEAVLTAHPNGSLHLQNLRHYFAGEYTCVIENPGGVTYIKFNVTVTTPFRNYVDFSMIYGAISATVFLFFGVTFALIRQCAVHFCCRHAQSIDKEIEEFEDLDISFEIYGAGCTPSPAPFTPRPSPHKCVTPAEDQEAANSLHESASHIMGTLIDVREKLRFNMERQVVRIRSRAESVRQTTQRQLLTIRDTSNAYVHTLRSSSTSAAQRVRTGVVMGVEQMKEHVQSFRELCGPGTVPQTVSTVSMATDIDSQERSKVVTTITYV